MFIYVQASDYDRFLRLDVEPEEPVRSIKDKINMEMGGVIPEEQLDTLNYVGIILDCGTPVRNYGVEESSLLYLGRNPHAPYTMHAPAPSMAMQGQVAANNAQAQQQPPQQQQTAISDSGQTLTSTQSIEQITSQPQTLSQQAQLVQQTTQQTTQAQPQYYDYQQPQPQSDYPQLQDYQQQEIPNIASVANYQPTAYQQYAAACTTAGYAAQQQPYYYGYPNY